MPSVYYAGCHTWSTIPASLLFSARIQGNANFGLWLGFSPGLHTSACNFRRCSPFFSARLERVHGCELMNTSKNTMALVMVSESCSRAWQSSLGLCVLLSAPISPAYQSTHLQRQSGPSPMAAKRLPQGRLILCDIQFILLGSISIAT